MYTRLRFTSSCFIGLFLCFQGPTVSGQALPVDVDALPGISGVERVVDEIERDIQSELEPLAEAGLDSPLDVDSLMSLPAASLPSLNTLPPILPMLDTQGVPVFEEVEIQPGVRVVRHEWLIGTAQRPETLAQNSHFQVLDERYLDALGLHVIRLRAIGPADSREALEAWLPADAHVLQRNFIYATQASSITPTDTAPNDAGGRPPLCEHEVSMGMLDTALDVALPSPTYPPQQASFIDEGLSAPVAHGTAVASRIFATAPGARLYAASVFYRRDAYSQGATSMSLLSGLNWLLEQNVTFINVSLTGPHDALLARAFAKAMDDGVMVVAAVGNAGPGAAPLFPAAYPGVVGVTAVDVEGEIYRWALQGEQVDIAAEGVRVPVWRSGNRWEKESGTSLASPIVTAQLACARISFANIEAYLAEHSRDLGEPGKDPIFGWGWLRP